jgi:integrase
MYAIMPVAKKRPASGCIETSVGISDEEESEDEDHGLMHHTPALALRHDEINEWLVCLGAFGGTRGAGEMHRLIEYWKLRGAMRPSEAIQLVPANFTKRSASWILRIQDNGFEIPSVGKLKKWGGRDIPLDKYASATCEALFSDRGLLVGTVLFRWVTGDVTPCFPGAAGSEPITIQAHNLAIRHARVQFAIERGDDSLNRISGNSMRRTAVHLFERAKVPPSWGMQFTGHLKAETYMSYASAPDFRDLQQVAEQCFSTYTM